MKFQKSSYIKRQSVHRIAAPNENVLSEHEMLLIRETAKLTENLYVKMICDNLAMEKIIRLM